MDRKPKTPEGIALGKRIAEAREHAKLNQLELAGRVGCKQQLISDLEAGWYRSTSHLVAIARFTGVSVWWLASGEGHMLADDVPLSLAQKQFATAFGALPEFGQKQLLEHLEIWKRHPRIPDAGAIVTKTTSIRSLPKKKPAARRSRGG